MGNRNLNAKLSTESIRRLQESLRSYRTELEFKCQFLVSELAQVGARVAQAKLDESPLGRYVRLQVDTKDGGAVAVAVLTATGDVFVSEKYADFYSLLAVEFGAGIHYNPTDPPHAKEFGFGVGTFPGQTHANEDGWYYWDDKAQEWRYTHGVKATMPMYSADMEIIQSVVKKAKEIFGR